MTPQNVRQIKFSQTLADLISQRPDGDVRKKICAAIGITQSSLSQYVNEKARPDLEKLGRLADHFGVSLDYLVYGDSQSTFNGNLDGRTDHVQNFIETRLESISVLAEERNWALFKIADILARKIDKVAERIITSPNSLKLDPHPGRISDQECLHLEMHAKHVRIFATDFTYDIERKSDGTYVPGKFYPIVRDNIQKGCVYQFILPRGTDWSVIIHSFQNFLKRDVGDLAASRCTFRVATRLYISGLGIIKVNIDVLREHYPALFYSLSGFSVDEHIGYIIPPSSRVHGDLLIAREKLGLTMELFTEVWDSATEPAGLVTDRKKRSSPKRSASKQL